MLRRAVFSDVQRKALEKMFQKQKYISKPDRKKLAAKLGLKDSQVSAVPPQHPPPPPFTASRHTRQLQGFGNRLGPTVQMGKPRPREGVSTRATTLEAPQDRTLLSPPPLASFSPRLSGPPTPPFGAGWQQVGQREPRADAGAESMRGSTWTHFWGWGADTAGRTEPAPHSTPRPVRPPGPQI